jgi:hypothetical protein
MFAVDLSLYFRRVMILENLRAEERHIQKQLKKTAAAYQEFEEYIIK